MTEVLGGMLLIKINCWEHNFAEAIATARENEVGVPGRNFRKLALLSEYINPIAPCLPLLGHENEAVRNYKSR